MKTSRTRPAVPEARSLFRQTLPSRSWLSELTWSKEASADLIRAAANNDLMHVAKQLQAGLKLRKKQKKVAQKVLALLAVEARGPACGTDVVRPAGLSAVLNTSLLGESFSEGAGRVKETVFADPSVDWQLFQERTSALIFLRLAAQDMDEETLLELLRQLCSVNLSHMEVDDQGDPPRHWLESGLLLVMLGTTLSDLRGSDQQIRRGRKLLRRWLAAEVDNQGHPMGRWVSELPLVLSKFAMATLFSDLNGTTLWDAQDRERLRDVILAGLGLASSGRMAFENSPHAIEIFYRAARGIGVFEKREPPLTLLRDWSRFDSSESSKRKESAKRRIWSLPDESWQSDVALWSALRTDWNSPADCCWVVHHAPTPQLELVLRDLPVVAGHWSSAWRVNGRTLPLLDRWKCECWFSDEEVDYLELTQHLDHQPEPNGPAAQLWAGVLLVRQVMFAKQDNFLVLTDSIRCPEERGIEYQAEIPLDAQLTWARDPATGEGALTRPGLRVRVLPLALPNSGMVLSPGSLDGAENRLSVMHSGTGRGMYVPLVFEWSPARKRLPTDWSQLTVAEDGRKISSDIACGYRFRIGTEQWMLYHELHRGRFPRSVLGMHTLIETVLARFQSDGQLKELLLVEGQSPQD